MKYETLTSVIRKHIKSALQKNIGELSESTIELKKIKIGVERTRSAAFGDFSSNVAMSLGLSASATMSLAHTICKSLPKKIFAKCEVVKPGFINMTLTIDTINKVLIDIFKQKSSYGKFACKKDVFNIEFVSANPTGLLHIGHARNAAYGDTLANIWQAYGITVHREYYTNDAGNQINMLGLSTLIRYKELFGTPAVFPEDGYHGDEIIDIATAIKEKYGDKYVAAEYSEKGITDEAISEVFKSFAKDYLLTIIRDTLLEMHVKFDIWSYESDVYKNNLIPSVLTELKPFIYEADGATFLKTTLKGDDKDRVLVKSDGGYTYFTPDIAYHKVKLSRGYDKIFNVWGADHKSYVDRIKIAVEFLGYKQEQVTVLLQQMIKLVKNGEEFKMSKRTGNSLTTMDLISSIGVDAMRWFLVSTSLNSHLEIDVEKATENNTNNPLFYVQYAHARINQLIDKKKDEYVFTSSFKDLVLPAERELIITLNSYKQLIESISNNYEVHRLNTYLIQLARSYHSYYTNNKIIDSENKKLSIQRYWLSFAVKQVIANALKLLTITAVDKM